MEVIINYKNHKRDSSSNLEKSEEMINQLKRQNEILKEEFLKQQKIISNYQDDSVTTNGENYEFIKDKIEMEYQDVINKLKLEV